MPKPAKVKVRVSTHPVVVMEAEVARKIRQHARTSMKAEVCGVLIGNTEHERMTVEACIPGINAAQGGAHVTFTQDTWEHIYKIKDKEYPDDKIVGWYHSHPGFGVFLSEHDLFIQQNFFSNPQQVAWVYDPHTDEEGCFGWIGGNIEKLSAIRVGYSQEVEITGATAQEFEDEDDGVALDSMANTGLDQRPAEPAWMKWAARVLGYASAVLLGLVSGYMLRNWQVSPVLDSYQQIINHPFEACKILLSIDAQQNGIVAAPQLPQQASPQQSSPQQSPAQQSPAQQSPAQQSPAQQSPAQQSQQQNAPATKGNNGKQ